MKLSEMFSHWGQVRADLIKTLDTFQTAELAYVPFEGSWSVGQIALHIADCEDNWLHGVVGAEIQPWIFYDIADYPTHEEIKRLLGKARERTVNLLAKFTLEDFDRRYELPQGQTLPLGWIIWHVLEHEIHHRGELSFILGTLGREGLDV